MKNELPTLDHSTDIEIGGVNFRHLITTHHRNVTVRTAIHTTNFPKRQGGVRFVERGSIDEVAHLAIGMSEKAAAADVPIDGLKCLIECPDGVPTSVAERGAIVAAHLRIANQIDPDIVFGPDMLAPESVLSFVAANHDLSRNVTGLTREFGGIDIDGNGLTALGISDAISSSCTNTQLQRVVIQGFGAVGAELSRILPRNFSVVAICNRRGLIRCEDGLDVAKYHAAWQEQGDDWICSADDSGVEFSDDIDSILTIPCDVLVPAARTVVIATASEIERAKRENPSVVAVERLVEAGAPKVIAEAANHPITAAAEVILEDAGTTILPDVLINCGGMIGCWYEYHNREALLRDGSEYEHSLDACRSRISETVNRNTLAVVSGRQAGQSSRDVTRSLIAR